MNHLALTGLLNMLDELKTTYENSIDFSPSSFPDYSTTEVPSQV